MGVDKLSPRGIVRSLEDTISQNAITPDLEVFPS
jgi:hypothetical protein